MRLADTRRKRSDTTRSLLDSPDGDGEGEGEAGAASTGEGVDTGEPMRERGIGRGEDEERPVKKRRKGEASQEQSQDGSTGLPWEKPKDPPEKPREMPQNKSEDMPQQEQQPAGPQMTPPPEKPKGDGVGVGGAQSDAGSPARTAPLAEEGRRTRRLRGRGSRRDGAGGCIEEPRRKRRRMRGRTRCEWAGAGGSVWSFG